MRLYVAPGCPFGHRAAFALREKKLAFDLQFFEPGKRPPELEAAGSRAKSPTLFVDNDVVYDSGAVLEYIEDRFPELPLMPATPAGRAGVRMAIVRMNEEIQPKLGAIFQAGMKHDDAAMATAVTELHKALAPFEAALREHAFVAGETFTIADICLYTPLAGNKRHYGIEPAADQTALRAWLEKVATRPTSALPA